MKKTIFILIATCCFSSLNAQDIVFLKDSVMSQYMEDGYANKHFMPKGEEDGKKLRQGAWKDYEVVSDFTMITKNGEPEQEFGYFLIYGEGNFVDGKRDGKWKLYVLEDKTFRKYLKQEVVYVKGEKEGNFTYYFPNGKPAIVGNYQNDAFEGKTTWYYENGKQYGTLHYKKDSREGNGTFRYQSGNIKDDLNFLSDSLTGTCINYYENGKIMQIADYTFNQLNGTYKYYYENGQLWIEKEYKNGLLMNVIGSYDDKGNKRDYGTIKDGNGTVKYYTEEGKVYNIQTFKFGVLINEEEQ